MKKHTLLIFQAVNEITCVQMLEQIKEAMHLFDLLEEPVIYYMELRLPFAFVVLDREYPVISSNLLESENLVATVEWISKANLDWYMRHKGVCKVKNVGSMLPLKHSGVSNGLTV